MISSLHRGSRTKVLLLAAAMILVVSLIDWRAAEDIPLGFLYLFPMLLVASVLGRWQIATVAVICTVLTEIFDEFTWNARTGIPRDVLYFSAFFGMGLFVYQVNRSRETSLLQLQKIEREAAARMEAEEQMHILVESSPAAIFTMDAAGTVLLANDAAHRLVGVPSGTLHGQSIRPFIPSLLTVPAPEENQGTFRTAMQCHGRRSDGEVFQADVWFSTYRTSTGPRLAAMVVDTSEDLRTREESSLHQLLAGSRILVGAVSHEVRNVCGAIAVVHENLARSGALARNKDFEALGTLLQALERIASMDLRQLANQAASIDLESLLEEVRIIVEPALQESGIDVAWQVERGLPAVWAEYQSLIQVLLNLIKNSERAVEHQAERRLSISAANSVDRVEIHVIDNGSGVAHPERLFRPFQHEAKATGLGLYLSRAFMRSFRGDLRYEASDNGAHFVVELLPVLSAEEAFQHQRDSSQSHNGEQHELERNNHEQRDSHSTGGRPQPLQGEPEPAAGNIA